MPVTTFDILRGDANHGKFERYSLEISEGMVVLDAILLIQAKFANDLAVRWNSESLRHLKDSIGSPHLPAVHEFQRLWSILGIAFGRSPVARRTAKLCSATSERSDRPEFQSRN